MVATRAITPLLNNWLLFSAVIEALFRRLGKPWDRMRVDYAVQQHEQWYLGDGHYGDGPDFHFDYYNSFVIHPLLLAVLDETSGESSAWRRIAQSTHARAQRHAAVLERLISPTGTFPPVGRSIAYRCGAFHHLALMAQLQRLPAPLEPAQVRGALLAVIEQTLSDANAFDAQGWLRIGLRGHQPALGERYISTGSLYLCSTAFLPLGLPPDNAFWSAPDAPWTQRWLWWHNEDGPIDQAM